jgi:hypothetical protein
VRVVLLPRDPRPALGEQGLAGRGVWGRPRPRSRPTGGGFDLQPRARRDQPSRHFLLGLSTSIKWRASATQDSRGSREIQPSARSGSRKTCRAPQAAQVKCFVRRLRSRSLARSRVAPHLRQWRRPSASKLAYRFIFGPRNDSRCPPRHERTEKRPAREGADRPACSEQDPRPIGVEVWGPKVGRVLRRRSERVALGAGPDGRTRACR